MQPIIRKVGVVLPYMYFLTWKAPVDGGKWRTPHTLELPFVFETYDKATVTGTGRERKVLGDRISGAWAAFASAHSARTCDHDFLTMNARLSTAPIEMRGWPSKTSDGLPRPNNLRIARRL